ncbi:MAG TPA: YdcF family protein [Patescibacteria group bacterium]|nr:YdcF family protein [Patescibacteria group bacterium]
MKDLSKEFLKAVGEYMLVETPLRRADVCLCFGGEHAEEIAQHAADLYHQGYFSLVVVSGQPNTSKGVMEAKAMRDVLLARGVPDEIILVEDRATNTGENVKFARELLDKTKGLENIQSVIGIGQIHGSRRFLMTLEQQWPQVTKMFTAPNYFPVSREDWHKDAKFRDAVLCEFNKVAPYKQVGFIREIDMEEVKRSIEKCPPPKGPRP